MTRVDFDSHGEPSTYRDLLHEVEHLRHRAPTVAQIVALVAIANRLDRIGDILSPVFDDPDDVA